MDPLHQDTTPLVSDPTKPKKSVDRVSIIFLISALLVIIVVIITISILIAIDIIPNPFKDNNDSNPQHHIGTYGKWSSYGGGPKNAQIAPIEANVTINEHNIKRLSLKCTHIIEGGRLYVGFITIDDENNAYIADGAGNVSKMNIDSCDKIWSVNIAKLLGYNSTDTTQQFRMRQSGTLFKNSNGDKGILFGAPSDGRIGISNFDPCYAIALSANDGTLLWKTSLSEGIETYRCRPHGFMVDENDHYAYGGQAVWGREGLGEFVAITRAKMFKLDTNDGKIIHKWYPIDNDKFGLNKNNINVSNPYQYRGPSIWNMPAIIDDYLIFGTANFQTYPKYVENCLLGINVDISLPIENANPFDPCYNDRSEDYRFWRCLEQGVFPCSFIILNKHTFNVENAIPLQGTDWDEDSCRDGNDGNYGCMKGQGPDSDLAAVAAYSHPNDGSLYGIAAQKSGHVYVFEIPSGRTVFAKKVGHFSSSGGSQWSIAVDEQNMIAIATITGGNTRPAQRYVTVLADGTKLCEMTGSIHGINLTTAETIWQIMNPWGTINDCDDIIYDDYVDIAVNATCQMDPNGNVIRDPFDTVIDGNVVRPPINESERDEIQTRDMGKFVGPLTISGDLVFIPSFSGDIFIHNLFNGRYIHTVQCPNRGLIKGGVTIIEDRVIFYCGTNQIVSMQLQLDE